MELKKLADQVLADGPPSASSSPFYPPFYPKIDF